DFLQALDRLGTLAPEVALHLEVRVDVIAELRDLGIGQVAHLLVRREPDLRTDLAGGRRPDTEDVGEGDLEPLVTREIYSCNSRQFFSLALSLLVPRIRANDQHLAVPLDHAATVTHGFNGSSDFHKKMRQATAK